jgi:hypothetical protein
MYETAIAKKQGSRPSHRGKTTPSPSAGHPVRATADNRRRTRRVLGIIAIVLCLAIAGYALAKGHILIAAVSLVALALVERTLLPVMKHLFRRQQQAERGTDAESKVAVALSQDPQNLLVLHNVAGPHGDLDHVVVRRNGAVIVIDTKSHAGRVVEAQGRLQLNGRPFEKNIVDQAHRNAMWLKDELKLRLDLRVFVHACLVFSNAFVAVRRPVRGVEVVNFSYLPRFLARLPADRRLQEIMERDPERIRGITSKRRE